MDNGLINYKMDEEKQDLIKITYNSSALISEESRCIFNSVGGTSYICSHPLISEEIRCNYIKDTKVPENCPLKSRALITKVELVEG